MPLSQSLNAKDVTFSEHNSKIKATGKGITNTHKPIHATQVEVKINVHCESISLVLSGDVFPMSKETRILGISWDQVLPPKAAKTCQNGHYLVFHLGLAGDSRPWLVLSLRPPTARSPAPGDSTGTGARATNEGSREEGRYCTNGANMAG